MRTPAGPGGLPVLDGALHVLLHLAALVGVPLGTRAGANIAESLVEWGRLIVYLLCFRTTNSDHYMQGRVGVRAGDGVSVQVDDIIGELVRRRRVPRTRCK